MPELWVPGFAGPLDDLIERIHRRIEAFAREAGIEHAYVGVELADGSRFPVETLSAEPGYGYVTTRPHPEEDGPAEVIVPIGSIRRIDVDSAADERGRLGFAVPPAS